MTTRNIFLCIQCIIYIFTLVLFAIKVANVELLILMTLAFVTFIGLYLSSKSRERK